MQINKEGLSLIKSFEGCRLEAYKPVATEVYWTIGYGHCGADVKKGAKITQKQAEEYLKKDLEKFEKYVTETKLKLNENQFSALVSFCYNCGKRNLQTLIKGRTIEQIGDALLKYNKAGGKVLAGLTKRRKAEQKLFLTPIKKAEKVSNATNKETNNKNETSAKTEIKKETKPKKETSAKAKKEITTADLPCEVKTTCDLNVRRAAGTTYPIIRVAKKGEKLKIWAILSSGEDRWGKNGEEYYCLKYCERI